MPGFGAAGTPVTIKGANFSTHVAGNIVYFGAVKATVTAATDSTLTALVPAGATYQPVTVTTNFLTAYSPLAFSAFSPGSTAVLPGNFSAPATFSTGSGTGNSLASDIDGDGRADLLTANTYDHSFSVLRNTSATGSISFAAKVDYPVNTVSITELKMAVGDLNGDSLPDVVVSLPGSNSTDWYNPANWTCGTLPDANTDVLIESGTVVLNTSTTVRSLKVRTGATVKVAPGVTLTILK